MKRIFLTFSTDSFFPRAKVCLDSIKKFHPEDESTIIKILQEKTNGTYVEGLAKNRIVVAKGFLANYDEVVVIGADCVLYDRIDNFLDMPGTVLIPHVITPPDNPAALYKTGHVNADLMLFRQCSLPLLNWLISQDMKEETNNGSFYEQTLLSATPFFFDNISICKDPSINIAYFNLHERILHGLKMFQFSGYIPGSPERISKHFDWNKIQRVDEATLELFRDYESRINGN